MDKTLGVAEQPKKDMSWKSFFLYLVLILIFRMYIIEPHTVTGDSMTDTFHTHDYVLVDKISYDVTDPKRGDVIVFNPPVKDRGEDRFIKRIIGIPGDTVAVSATGTLVNGVKQDETFVVYSSPRPAEVTLGKDEYFVMGDNRAVSYDSRSWGVLTRDAIQGRVILRLYPFNQIGFLPGALTH